MHLSDLSPPLLKGVDPAGGCDGGRLCAVTVALFFFFLHLQSETRPK
jgi:hypothetical protein